MAKIKEEQAELEGVLSVAKATLVAELYMTAPPQRREPGKGGSGRNNDLITTTPLPERGRI